MTRQSDSSMKEDRSSSRVRYIVIVSRNMFSDKRAILWNSDEILVLIYLNPSAGHCLFHPLQFSWSSERFPTFRVRLFTKWPQSQRDTATKKDQRPLESLPTQSTVWLVTTEASKNRIKKECLPAGSHAGKDSLGRLSRSYSVTKDRAARLAWLTNRATSHLLRIWIKIKQLGWGLNLPVPIHCLELVRSSRRPFDFRN